MATSSEAPSALSNTDFRKRAIAYTIKWRTNERKLKVDSINQIKQKPSIPPPFPPFETLRLLQEKKRKKQHTRSYILQKRFSKMHPE
ncbi:hypothetical protein POREN0001_1263 [Porphyromonas endodontalis ATCC 35406]|uniref:Uncharacterized protein n=1 Tax=Porphyromonas endodontalis (strain ATCC 35406 / DSM 24491 / JCM 8526 / CCUG 16442 / BCRC 14492 / NCTC 13058 / HG 370) TaxID=553175 RepID=C3J820_POREA|nr:hypothetical protein POREN0001_1263 [Porphyromonas endodontalis ATCC 35406]